MTRVTSREGLVLLDGKPLENAEAHGISLQLLYELGPRRVGYLTVEEIRDTYEQVAREAEKQPA